MKPPVGSSGNSIGKSGLAGARPPEGVVWWLVDDTPDRDSITAAEAADELLLMGEESSPEVDIDAMIRDSKGAWSSLDGRNSGPCE